MQHSVQRTVYAEFVYFALLHKNNQYVHHPIGCRKTKSKKKIRPTYPIYKKSVTGNIQLFFLGLRGNIKTEAPNDLILVGGDTFNLNVFI